MGPGGFRFHGARAGHRRGPPESRVPADAASGSETGSEGGTVYSMTLTRPPS